MTLDIPRRFATIGNVMTNDTAMTILAQLGGSRFLAMTGATNLIDHGDGLSFKVGKNDRGVTHATIVLNSADLYDVEFRRVTKRGLNVALLASIPGVYAESLRSVFETETGLRTSL